MPWPSNTPDEPANPTAQPAWVQPVQVGPTPEEIAASVVDWQTKTAQLATIKETEMESRKKLTAMLFPTPKKGTQRFGFQNGYAIKLVHKQNMNLGLDLTDPATGQKVPKNVQIENAMDAIEKTGPQGQFLVDRLIKTTYELSQSEYNKLDLNIPEHVEIKRIIDEILIVTDASPSLEMEEPKAPK